MRYKTFTPSINNGFSNQFKNLDNNEMINLRGGDNTEPPLPPTSGDDFPIDPFAKAARFSIQLVPVVGKKIV